MSYKLSIITPQGLIFEDTVDSVAVSGLMGGFEVFSNHEPIVAALKEGQVKVRFQGGEKVFNTQSGVLEVKPDHQVLVLVDSA